MAVGDRVDYNPFEPDFYVSDPFAVYRWMHDEEPCTATSSGGGGS